MPLIYTPGTLPQPIPKTPPPGYTGNMIMPPMPEPPLLYACPVCDRTDELATLEEVSGVAPAMFLNDGDDPVWEGTTHYTESITVGVLCRACSWQVRCTDWAAHLTLTDESPDPE